MSTVADPDSMPAWNRRREALLDGIVDHVLAHGIADLTLRTVAKAVGSNNRMLLYYFGSRDELILTALAAAGDRFPTMRSLRDALGDPSVALPDRLARVWQALSASETLPFLKLFFQVLGLAGFEQDRFRNFLATVGTEWADQLAAALGAEGVPAAAAQALAHEIVALWRGLQVTLISTGDRGLVDGIAATTIARLDLRVRALADGDNTR